MGLYDGYRLANSQTVKQYEGSVVPELVAVSQEMQKRYDTSLDQQDYAGRFMNSMKALPQDQAALEEVKGMYKTKLDTLSKRPDLENAVRQSTMLARDLPQEYAGFAQRQQDFAQRKDEYDKKVSDGKLSPDEAQRLLQRDIHQDKGIQRDPSNGKFSGRFTGQQYVDTFDMQKAVDTIMDKQFPQTQGWSREQVGDQWIFKNGNKTVKLPAERIQQIVSTGLQNDPQAMSWIAQQQNLGTYNMDFSKVDPNSIKKSSAILERLKAGKDLTTAVKEVTSAGITNDIIGKAHAYAVSKYYRNDSESNQAISANPYGTIKASQVDTTPRFLIPGNDTVLEDKDKDLSQLNTTISGLQNSITAMEGDMKLADPAGRARIQTQLDQTKDQLLAKQELLTNTKNAIAQKLSGGQYKTESEYYDKTSKAKVLAALPVSVTGTVNGSKAILTKDEIHDALINNRINYKPGSSTGSGGFGMGTGSVESPIITITLKDGRKVKVDNKDFDKVANGMQASQKITQPFEQAIKTELANNASSYAFKPLSMNLSDEEQKGLQAIIKAEPNSVAWTKPGTTQRIKDGDLPAGMDIGSMKVIAKNGSFYLNSSGYDVEKGQKVPNGETYTAKITPGSNVGRKIAANLIKEGKGIQNLDSDMLLTVGVLSGQYKYTGDIASLQNYEPLHIKDKSGSTFLRAQRIKGTTESDQVPIYGLVDDKGQVIKDGAGNFYQTSDPTTVDYWIQHALQADMQKK